MKRSSSLQSFDYLTDLSDRQRGSLERIANDHTHLRTVRDPVTNPNTLDFGGLTGKWLPSGIRTSIPISLITYFDEGTHGIGIIANLFSNSKQNQARYGGKIRSAILVA